MKTMIQAAAVTLFAASAAHAQQRVQWRVQDGGNGHWYQLRAAPLQSWADCAIQAQESGGSLATLATPGENGFVVAAFAGSSTRYPWIGLSQAPDAAEPSAGWSWVTGEPLSWSNWSPSEPNGDGAFDADQANLWLVEEPGRPRGTWNDWHTGGPDGFLVEWSADCNNDGIVDYGQCCDGSLPDYNGNNIPDCCEAGTPCVVGNYPVQWRVVDGGNGHWYQSLQCPGCCFSSAVQSARNVGAHLATLTTAGEQARLIPVIPVGQAAKLGGFRSPDSDQVSGWQWMTGEVFSPPLVSWAEGNPGCCGPSQFWLYLQNTPGPGTGLHDGFDCSPTGADLLLLEWSADCNDDGIVDYGQILQGQVADSDQDGIPDICQVPMCEDADLFRDFNVNGADLGILLSQWGPNTPLTVSDINDDGVVNGADLGLLLSFWGSCP